MLSRRQFVFGSAALAAGIPNLALAATPKPRKVKGESRRLFLVHLHTGERVDATYWRDGAYDQAALDDLDNLLRDWRTGEIVPMQRPLLDSLHGLLARIGYRGPVSVICGYRAPETNERLAKGGARVARDSQHAYGRAIDIAVPGEALRQLRDAANSHWKGGVGWYPKNRFIHLDTARNRRWGFEEA